MSVCEGGGGGGGTERSDTLFASEDPDIGNADPKVATLKKYPDRDSWK